MITREVVYKVRWSLLGNNTHTATNAVRRVSTVNSHLPIAQSPTPNR
jgi:hypothetical protein